MRIQDFIEKLQKKASFDPDMEIVDLIWTTQDIQEHLSMLDISLNKKGISMVIEDLENIDSSLGINLETIDLAIEDVHRDYCIYRSYLSNKESLAFLTERSFCEYYYITSETLDHLKDTFKEDH